MAPCEEFRYNSDHAQGRVLGTMVAVSFVGLLTIIDTPQRITVLGLVPLAGGLLIGVPTGFWHLVLLSGVLSARMALPSKWWWSPEDLHFHLTESELARLWPWFTTGGIGFARWLVRALAAMSGLLVR